VITGSGTVGFCRGGQDFNENRPHSSLDNATPKEFAAQSMLEIGSSNQVFEVAKNDLHI